LKPATDGFKTRSRGKPVRRYAGLETRSKSYGLSLDIRMQYLDSREPRACYNPTKRAVHVDDGT
jgi:hypothetical protein